MTTGHILSWIYNCTKPGNWSIDNATTEQFALHISILQLHIAQIVINCMLKYALDDSHVKSYEH